MPLRGYRSAFKTTHTLITIVITRRRRPHKLGFTHNNAQHTKYILNSRRGKGLEKCNQQPTPREGEGLETNKNTNTTINNQNTAHEYKQNPKPLKRQDGHTDKTETKTRHDQEGQEVSVQACLKGTPEEKPKHKHDKKIRHTQH